MSKKNNNRVREFAAFISLFAAGFVQVEGMNAIEWWDPKTYCILLISLFLILIPSVFSSTAYGGPYDGMHFGEFAQMMKR
jgi:hypothetical protein